MNVPVNTPTTVSIRIPKKVLRETTNQGVVIPLTLTSQTPNCNINNRLDYPVIIKSRAPQCTNRRVTLDTPTAVKVGQQMSIKSTVSRATVHGDDSAKVKLEYKINN